MNDGGGAQELQNIEILFLEGVHFHSINEYFLAITKKISLLNFLKRQDTSKIYRSKSIESPQQRIFIYENQGKQISFQEWRNEKNNEMYYWLQAGEQKYMDEQKEKRCDFKIIIKSEIQIINSKQKNRSLVRVIIKRFCKPLANELFQQLIKMGSRQYIYKPNFCNQSNLNEIIYPSLEVVDPIVFSRKETDQQLILVLNQSNLRETPFYVSAIEQMTKSDNRGLSKIIGHPSSIFLVFLINQKGKFDEKMKEILLNYRHLSQRRSQPLHNVTRSQILKGVFFKTFSEQNILNPSLVEFLIDNIVNDQFISDFTILIQLYYKIFLKEEITKHEIEEAIEHYFFSQEQDIQKYAYSFSSLLAFVQFRHNLQCNGLIERLIKDIGYKFGQMEAITLEDLYNYNKIQFTFIGLDLNDQSVRFFNHTTTPKLPIVVLLSLVQFLPTPYKSFLWRQQWGNYRILHETTIKEINITMHEIVDSRFLLESPLDLIQDQHLRNRYMKKSSKNVVIHALSAARKKVEQLQEIEELKSLLKSMKSNAIDSIPKFRLIWKILTTKNSIDLDLNNLDTFRQIPLLSRIIQLDQTYKVYLQNLNRQANEERILKSKIHNLYQTNLQIPRMISNLDTMAQLINEFILNETYSQKDIEELFLQAQKIEKEANRYAMKSYDQYLYIVSRIKNLIKNVHIQTKYKYKIKIQTIVEEINSFDEYLDYQSVDLKVKQLLKQLKNAKIRTRNDPRELDAYSSSYYRDTFSAMFEKEKVSEKLSFLQSEFKAQLQDFTSQFVSREPELAFVQYEKIMYRFCRQFLKIMEKVSSTIHVKNLFYEIFKLTPYLFKLEEMLKSEFIMKEEIKNLLNKFKVYKRFHLILSGQPHTLLELGNKLLLMKNCVQKSSISEITATNHHAIAAILFALDLDNQTYIEQLIGLQQLIKVNSGNQNEDHLDLIELLLKKPQNPGEDEQSHDLYLKIARKYQNAFKLLIKLQNECHLNIHSLYELIAEYDRQQQSAPLSLKEAEIISFLEQLLQNQEKFNSKVALINENKEMIYQKLKTNKIGIKFIIRFLYRNLERQTNWFNIHKSKYKTLQIYQNYLKQLFAKYNMPKSMTLLQFNQSNQLKIQINFVLVNCNKNKYEVFSSNQRGYVKLIDLLLAAVACPVDFDVKAINIRDMSNQQRISDVLKKNQSKFTEAFKEERYWSNFGSNSAPFNLLQTQSNIENTLLCSFQFVHQTFQPSVRRSFLRRDSVKSSKKEEKNNLRAIDLLSIWWTKNQKLTPELKQILFGSIFQSPFLSYYYLIQNSSYEALKQRQDKRNLVDLSGTCDCLIEKGKYIGYFFNNEAKNDSKVILKIRLLDIRQIEIELIAISANLEIKLVIIDKYLQEGQIYRFQQTSSIDLMLYCFHEQNLEVYSISLRSTKERGLVQYYEIKASNKEISIIQLTSSLQVSKSFNSQNYDSNLTLFQLKCCSLCGKNANQQHFQPEISTCSTCNKGDHQIKRGNLNLYLLAQDSYMSDYQQLKCKILEEVRQSNVLSSQIQSKKANYLFCCLCFNRQQQ